MQSHGFDMSYNSCVKGEGLPFWGLNLPASGPISPQKVGLSLLAAFPRQAQTSSDRPLYPSAKN